MRRETGFRDVEGLTWSVSGKTVAQGHERGAGPEPQHCRQSSTCNIQHTSGTILYLCGQWGLVGARPAASESNRYPFHMGSLWREAWAVHARTHTRTHTSRSTTEIVFTEITYGENRTLPILSMSRHKPPTHLHLLF